MYRERYGQWPSDAWLMPIALWEIANLADADSFRSITGHLELHTRDGMGLTVGGPDGKVEYGQESFNFGWEAVEAAGEWLGAKRRPDLEDYE